MSDRLYIDVCSGMATCVRVEAVLRIFLAAGRAI
jgi:hypothetical protein